MGNSKLIFSSWPNLIIMSWILNGCTGQHAFVPAPPKPIVQSTTENSIRIESNWAPEPPKELPKAIEPAEGIQNFPEPVDRVGLALMADGIRVLAVGGNQSVWWNSSSPNYSTNWSAGTSNFDMPYGRTQILSFDGFRSARWVEARGPNGSYAEMPFHSVTLGSGTGGTATLAVGSAALQSIPDDPQHQTINAGPRSNAMQAAYQLNGKNKEQVLVFGGNRGTNSPQFLFSPYTGETVANPRVYREDSFDQSTGISIGNWEIPVIEPPGAVITTRNGYSAVRDPMGNWLFVGGVNTPNPTDFWITNEIIRYRVATENSPGRLESRYLNCSALANKNKWLRGGAKAVLSYDVASGNYLIYQIGGKSGSDNLGGGMSSRNTILRVNLGPDLNNPLPCSDVTVTLIPLPALELVRVPNSSATVIPHLSAIQPEIGATTTQVPNDEYYGTFDQAMSIIQRGPHAGKVLFLGGIHFVRNPAPVGGQLYHWASPIEGVVGRSSSQSNPTGLYSSELPSSDVLLFDPMTGKVEKVASLPAGRFNHAMAELDRPEGKFIIYSGSSNVMTYASSGGALPAWILNTSDWTFQSLDDSVIDGRAGLSSVQWTDWSITFFGFDINTLLWVGGSDKQYPDPSVTTLFKKTYPDVFKF